MNYFNLFKIIKFFVKIIVLMEEIEFIEEKRIIQTKSNY